MSLNRFNPQRDHNEKAVVAAFKAAGALVWLISGKAIPDLLVGLHGRWVVVEVKSPSGKLNPHQQAFFDLARQRELPAYICRGAGDVKRILELMK